MFDVSYLQNLSNLKAFKIDVYINLKLPVVLIEKQSGCGINI